MIGSVDSLDICTELPVIEMDAVPLDCWQDIHVSNIWIPDHLLPSRSKSCSKRVTQGIYHTLEKKDPSKYNESFSVYSYSDVENEQGEIFLSDSDEDIFGSDCTSFEKIETFSDNTVAVVGDVPPSNNACGNDVENYIETMNLNENFERKEYSDSEEKVNVKTCLDEIDGKGEKVPGVLSSEDIVMNSRNQDQDSRIPVKNISESVITESLENIHLVKAFDESKSKDFKNGDMQISRKLNTDTDSLSVISLNDILDVTPEINIKDFAFNLKKSDDLAVSLHNKPNLKKSKKNKKVKKKSTKCVTLDEFLEDSIEISQDYYCDKYFENILHEKGKNNHLTGMASKAEFPDLVTEEIKCAHSSKTNEAHSELSFKCFARDLMKSDKIKNNENCVDSEEIDLSMKDNKKYGKIIIENIPLHVSKDDIFPILCDYGQIKGFSMVSAGKFLKAYVEIDLNCDIDWIVVCLDGSEPFGASSEVLKCYKQNNE